MEILAGALTIVVAVMIAFLIIGGALTILIGEINDWWSKQQTDYIEEDPPPQELPEDYKKDWDNLPF